MAVKRSPPSPIIGGIRAWWNCHRTWLRICGQLKRAGVEEFDPVYPLIREIGMVPARISRLVIIGLGIQLIILLLVVGLISYLGASHGIETIRGKDGSTIVTIDAPNGGKFVMCQVPKRICLQIL